MSVSMLMRTRSLRITPLLVCSLYLCASVTFGEPVAWAQNGSSNEKESSVSSDEDVDRSEDDALELLPDSRILSVIESSCGDAECAPDDGALVLDPVEVAAPKESGGDDFETTKTGTLRLQTVDFEEYSSTSGVDRILNRIRGVKARNSGGMLQAQTISLRGAAAQDVAVTYRGVSINSLSDAVADMAYFAPEILGKAHVYGTGSTSLPGGAAGMIELMGSDSSAPIIARISGTTLADFGLFARGSLQPGDHRVSASFFGDRSPGEFRYVDAQGSPQYRQHNAAARTGGELVYDAFLDEIHIAAFSFLSRIDRQEAGVSEFPDAYRRAYNAQWLALNRLALDTMPIAMGQSYASFAIELAQRTSKKSYDNPTMAIGKRSLNTRHFENTTHIAAGGEWDWAGISTTKVDLQYDYQRVETLYKSGNQSLTQTHDRHIFSASVAESLNFLRDSLTINASGKVDRWGDAQWMASASASIRYQTPIHLTLGFSGAYAQRLPSFDELYYQTEFVRGNPELNPQKSAIHELSIAYDYGDWITLRLSGFYNLHRDLIRFVPETPTLMRARNFADSTARGVDFSVVWNIYSGLGIKLDYAWTDARTKNKRRMPQVPEHSVSGEIFYDYEHFSFAFFAQYESAMAQNVSATDYGDDRVELSIEAALSLPFGATISLAVYNLLDVQTRQDVLQRPLPGRYGAVALRLAPF